MDSSNSSPDLLALALGSYTVDLEKMTPEERFHLVQGIIDQCQPLKYFPSFRSVAELVNGKHKGFVSETPSEVLKVEVPLGRLFELALLSRHSFPAGERGEEFIIARESLLVDDTGKFVSWTERIKKTEDLYGVKAIAELSHFSLLSDQNMREILTDSSLIKDLIKNLAWAAQEDAPKRFERMRRLERADVFLQTLRDRLTVGAPHDPGDDIPF